MAQRILNDLEVDGRIIKKGGTSSQALMANGSVAVLSPVAISGDYNSLTNLPDLGTAAFAEITDFATAAQGAKADTALQVETQTTLNQPTLTGNVLTVSYTGENGAVQNKSIDLSGLVLTDIHLDGATYDASQNKITLTLNDGTFYTIDLSEFSIIPSTNASGVTTLTQEGVVKATISKVGQSGDYNDLLNLPATGVGSLTVPNNEFIVGNASNVGSTRKILPSDLNLTANNTLAVRLNTSNWSVMGFDSFAGFNTFALRSATGQLRATDPVGNSDVVTLGYLNTQATNNYVVTSTTNGTTGVTTLTQGGVTKATISKVGQSGNYTDLIGTPTFATINSQSITAGGNINTGWQRTPNTETGITSTTRIESQNSSDHVQLNSRTRMSRDSVIYDPFSGSPRGMLTFYSQNVFLGSRGASQLVFNGTAPTGTGNVFIGELSGTALTAGAANVCLGQNAGSNITTGSSNILIGFNTQPQQGTSNNLVIGPFIFGNQESGTKVGIANTNPQEALDVTGSIKQSIVTNALIKADSTGKLVAATSADFGNKYVSTFGDGATTLYNINHALASMDIICSLWEVSTNKMVEADITIVDSNNVTVQFAVAPTTNNIKIVILK